MEEEQDPGAALALVRETRRAAAERVRAPAWYHPAVGAVIGIMIGSLESSRNTGLVAIALSILALLMVHYQKHTGTWVNGFTAGGPRSRRMMWGGMALIFGVTAVAAWLKFARGVDGVMIAAGIAVALFATWLGFAWERRFREEAGA